MKVRVYIDYVPVKIFIPIKNGIAAPDEVATKAGLSGAWIEIDNSQLPSDKSHRYAWVHSNGMIIEDTVKIEQKNTLSQETVAQKEAVLQKLGITQQEFEKLIQ